MIPLLLLATAHAELDPGSALGIRTFNILDAELDPIGYVVVTGASYNGGTWSAAKDYWFWDSTDPFPTGGFTLTVYGTTPPAGLAPADAFRYPNLPFAEETGTCTNNTSARWFRLWTGNTVVGWMRDAGGDGARWYAFGDGNGDAPPYFGLPSTTVDSEYLKFDGPVGSPPGSLSNCSEIFTAQEAAP